MNRDVGTPEQRRRAAAHAALGDPVRLAIADLLSIGDRSPKELAHRVGLPTNLLAHHLGVMEEAGLIGRRQSEGDRRRSYVQLRYDEPLVAALVTTPAALAAGKRVVFVCTANSARSQLAAARWRQVSDIPVTSAGTHPADRVHPRAVSVGGRHHLDLRDQGTRQLSDVIQAGDLVVAVCDQAHELLERAVDASSVTAIHWSVPDPVQIGTNAAFESAFTDIAARIDRLDQSLANQS